MGQRQCFNCKHLRRYYVKGNVRFNPTKFGWCTVKGEVVDTVGSCDRLAFRKKTRMAYWSIKSSLDELLMQLTLLRDMVEEQDGEGENV